MSRPILQSCGMDGTVHGFSHVPSLSIYPPNPSVPSHPTVLLDGTGLCMGFSHVPSLSIYPPNPSVPSCPTVLLDGNDCPWDSHMSHPGVYPTIPQNHSHRSLCTNSIQWNPSITDTIGNQHFVSYSEVSLTQRLLVYFW